MKLNLWVRKSPPVPSAAQETLEQIKNLLFPPLSIKSLVDNDGKTVKYHIDFSVDTNLEAAFMDLQDGSNDSVTQNTINSVIKRLIAVRKILNVQTEIDPEAEYISVENSEIARSVEDVL